MIRALMVAAAVAWTAIACGGSESTPAAGTGAGADVGSAADSGAPTADPGAPGADPGGPVEPPPPTPEGPSDGKVAYPPPIGKISCQDTLFVDAPGLTWVEVDVAPSAGMDGLRSAINDSDRAKPTRIRVAAGTYTGQCLYVEDHLRTAAAPLWLQAQGAVQIDCSDGNGQAFGFVHSSYIAIEGFTFGPETGYYGDSGVHVGGRPYHPEDPASYGLWEASHHFIIRGNVMRNLNRGPDGDGNADHYESGCCDGAKSNQTEWVWYIGNTISRTARHGIDNVGVHHAAACGNHFFDMVGEGQGVEAKGGSYDILFEANTFDRVFHRALMLGGEGTNNNFMWPTDFPSEAYGIVARNNAIVNASDGGVTFYGCWSCAAVNNSVWFTPGYKLVETHDFMRMYPSVLEDGVYDEWGQAKRVGEVLTNKGNRVVNNLFGAAGGDATCALDAAGDGNGTLELTMHHNLLWNGGSPLPECGEGKNSIAGYPDAGSFADPKVTAAGAFPATKANLAPLAGSPLISAGVADPAAPPADAQGKARSSPPSIGAYEP